MHVQRLTATAISIGAALAFGAPAKAGNLPESGTIKLHSNLKANVQLTQVGEKPVMWTTTAWGVSYDDAGSGPLHMGAFVCVGAANEVNGSFNESGLAHSETPEARTKSLPHFRGREPATFLNTGPALLRAAPGGMPVSEVRGLINANQPIQRSSWRLARSSSTTS